MTKLRPHPLTDLFPMLPDDELADFADDIKVNGLMEPIALADGLVVDGRNRLKACEIAGVEPRFTQLNGQDIRAYIVAHNIKRRHLTKGQRAMALAMIYPEPERGGRKDRGSIAREMGLSGERLRIARIVLREAPELAKHVLRGDGISLDEALAIAALPEKQQREIAERAQAGEKVSVKQQVKKAQRANRERQLATRTIAASDALNTKTYGVILCDCPWRFEPYSRETGMDRAADNHYPTMQTEAIKAMRVPAARDCVLFMWATMPMLPQALEVMAAWGFEYKSHCVWGKDKIGSGYWFREQHELLLVGTRGDVPAPAPGEQYASLQMAPREAHSAKPAKFHQMIDTMYPNVPKLEMFARSLRVGWQQWGNEAPSSSLWLLASDV